MRDYSATIRRLRRARGWTRQEQLAAAAGLDKETVGRAESGGNLSIGSLAQIAAALDVDLSELFCDVSKMSDADAALWNALSDEQQNVLRKAMRMFLRGHL